MLKGREICGGKSTVFVVLFYSRVVVSHHVFYLRYVAALTRTLPSRREGNREPGGGGNTGRGSSGKAKQTGT